MWIRHAHAGGAVAAAPPAPAAQAADLIERDEAMPVVPRPRGRATAVGDGLCFALLLLTGALLLASVVVVVVEIVLRYFLRSDLTSAEALLSLLFTWLAFLGMPRALWNGRVPRIGLLKRLAERPRAVAHGAEVGASVVFFAMIIWSYTKLFASQADTSLGTLHVPAYVQGLAAPVGAALMLFITLLEPRGWTREKAAGAVAGAVGVVALFELKLPPDLSLALGALALLAIDAPIAVALGVGGAAMILRGDPASLSLPASQILQPMQNIALLAIPLFMFMGAAVAHSSLGRNLARFVRALLGWLPGGTGVACIGTSALFANLSGSAIADTAAVGTVYVPQLLESGYTRPRAAALQAAAGVVGVVFPPAIAMILFSTVANVDVLQVFKAVIVPGLMVVVVMMAIAIAGALRHATARTPFTFRELGRSIPRAIPVLLIPVILDGGIFSGVFTPAESGAVAILSVLVLGMLVRGIKLRGLGQAVTHAVDNAAMVMFILVAVSILDYGFTVSGASEQVNSLLSVAGDSHLLFLLIVNAIFMVVHEFVDAAPAILVLVPLIMPTATALGVSPLQLAAVIAINSSIGAVLPPVGVNLFVASQLAGVDAGKALRPVLSYVAGSAVVLAIVTLVPWCSTWLPGL